MEFRKIDHLRRLQIGVIGLVAVVLLVGLAAMLTDRSASVGETKVTDAEGNVTITKADGSEVSASDPLNEIGVQPAQSPENAPEKTPKNDALPAPVAPGENVPDLEPSAPR